MLHPIRQRWICLSVTTCRVRVLYRTGCVAVIPSSGRWITGAARRAEARHRAHESHVVTRN